MRIIFTINIKSIPCQLLFHYGYVNIFSDVDLIRSCFRGRLVYLRSIFQYWRIQRKEIELFLVTFGSKFLKTQFNIRFGQSVRITCDDIPIVMQICRPCNALRKYVLFYWMSQVFLVFFSTVPFIVKAATYACSRQ